MTISLKIKLNKKKLCLYIIFNSLIFICQKTFSDYVNPFIGTGGHGHTFPGAVLPFGMVQLSPDTRTDNSWDGCSGYHYSDSLIYGFSHTHLSGTGCSDWGDILIMPTMEVPTMDNKKYCSRFTHKKEKATAGFYEVELEKNKIKAELTVTQRVGIHRYTFQKKGKANIIVDLLHRDKTLLCDLKILDSMTICGYRISEAWAKEQHIYFVMKFSKKIDKIEFATNKVFNTINHLNGKPTEGSYLSFNLDESKQLMVKVAISVVSIEGAINNLNAEANHWNFDLYKNNSKLIWNNQLKKIEVEDPKIDKLTIFYTALYHSFIHPSLNMDSDNQYRGRDNKIHTASGFINYSVFSLWDTYRALHPLFTIIETNQTYNFINSFINQYNQSQRLPVWELSSNETNCMIGFHSVSVIADAYNKGIKGFDLELAYNAMKSASNYSALGIPTFNKKGFLEIDDESESVSKSLEYGYDNWCIAQIAKQLDKKEDVDLYLKRSLAYKNLFNKTNGFICPRRNGNWLIPFYPSEINNHFTEGNSWQYSFYAPHDIGGLIKLHGGTKKFENKLDDLFNTNEKTRGRDQADVTGLIGQYAHGNEPSHHMAYLYNFVGKPQKTVSKVHQICNNFYKNSTDGLIGNEDCGQMSAWYVFSSIGFYPVCPGSINYIIGKPIFNKIKINLENGNTFLITSNPTPNKTEISEVILNKISSYKSSINHFSIINGGSLEFNFTNKTNKEINYGKIDSTYLSSIVSDITNVVAPIIESSSQVIKDSVKISIVNNEPSNQIHFTTDGKKPTKNSTLFSKPFFIDTNCVIKAISFSINDSSSETVSRFYKLKYNYIINIASKANSQYTADGPQSLIDGIIGEKDWQKGYWLGYQNQDFECTLDLKEKKEINYLSINCLQDTRSWIVFPSKVNFYTSNDGITYQLIDEEINLTEANSYEIKLQKFEKKFINKISTRYLKIIAKNYGKLPDWHIGKGGDAFIFVDEIEIK